MRYYTKEYYTLMMSLGTADLYEPVIDKDYTDEEIEELYQKALDRYIEEERASYDEPPELDFDEADDPEYVEMLKAEFEEYENREPFDEEEAAEEFRETYEDNLEEPDEDLPDWVMEAVDKRILAMYFMPEKIYRKLAEEDAANEEKFEALDGRADEAYEEMRGDIPDDYEELMDTLDELESCDVIGAKIDSDEIELQIEGWDDEGEEVLYTLRFDEVEVLENDGVEVKSWTDEDGDLMSDCEFLFAEMYFEGERPEIHMLFDNNGLKYLTFMISDAYAYRTANE